MYNTSVFDIRCPAQVDANWLAAALWTPSHPDQMGATPHDYRTRPHRSNQHEMSEAADLRFVATAPCTFCDRISGEREQNSYLEIG